ncbi:MAG: helix-turn-helix transcriptional regulator [Candidatus Omnitrophica bacterium]|nr:helix-turn-helix transcriptional regulator [Candidatus Omnitrophota bacterium]
MIGDNIKKLRNKKGFRRDGLARKAVVSYTFLTKLESNVVKKPSIQTRAKIAKALNVNKDGHIYDG